MGHGRRTDVFSYINLQIVQPDYLHVGCKMKATCHILVNDLQFVPDREECLVLYLTPRRVLYITQESVLYCILPERVFFL